jgi:hypothetical protein
MVHFSWYVGMPAGVVSRLWQLCIQHGLQVHLQVPFVCPTRAAVLVNHPNEPAWFVIALFTQGWT